MRDFGGNVDEVVEKNGETLGFRHSDESSYSCVVCEREKKMEREMGCDTVYSWVFGWVLPV